MDFTLGNVIILVCVPSLMKHRVKSFFIIRKVIRIYVTAIEGDFLGIRIKIAVIALAQILNIKIA